MGKEVGSCFLCELTFLYKEDRPGPAPSFQFVLVLLFGEPNQLHITPDFWLQINWFVAITGESGQTRGKPVSGAIPGQSSSYPILLVFPLEMGNK